LVILARLLLGIVLGTLLAIGGYFVGWYIAFSLPAGVPRMPFLIAPTGIGGGVGTFLAWWLDLEGGSDGNRLLVLAPLALAVIFALGGAWGGFWYGEDIEGTRVWRHPTTQAILNGTVIASNSALLVWHVGIRLSHRPTPPETSVSLLRSWRSERPGSRGSDGEGFAGKE
jgi:hypothetical protein